MTIFYSVINNATIKQVINLTINRNKSLKVPKLCRIFSANLRTFADTRSCPILYLRWTEIKVIEKS